MSHLFNLITDTPLFTDTWFYTFKQDVNPATTQVFFNLDCRTKLNIDETKEKVCIIPDEPLNCSMINKTAKQYPDIKFLIISDLFHYDYPWESNVHTFDYCTAIQFVGHVLKNLTNANYVFAKQKKIDYRFSSLSHMAKQHRQISTLGLLKFAKNSSIISWHNVRSTTQENQNLFSSCDLEHQFNLTDTQILQDYFLLNAPEFANTKYDIDDLFNNYAFTNTLFNLTNETVSYGFYQDDQISYIRPGPFVDDKTWKTLMSGTGCLFVGQPFAYKKLKEKYFLDIKYPDVDLSYDNCPGDIDRYKKILNTLEQISSISDRYFESAVLEECYRIQKQILDLDYFYLLAEKNQDHDEKILQFLHK